MAYPFDQTWNNWIEVESDESETDAKLKRDSNQTDADLIFSESSPSSTSSLTFSPNVVIPRPVEGPWASLFEPLRKLFVPVLPLVPTPYLKDFQGQLLHNPQIHPLDTHVAAADEPHLYWIDGSCEQVVSVTTLVHNFFPHFDNKAAAQKVTQGRDWQNRHRPSNRYHGCETVDDIINNWNRSGDDGTNLHACIEDYFNGNTTRRFPLVPANEKCWNQFQRWWENFAQHHYVFEQCEKMVFDRRARVAGRIDWFGHLKDHPEEKVILDWKRTKGINGFDFYQKQCGFGPCSQFSNCNLSTYSLQQAIYWAICERNYGYTIYSASLVQLFPAIPEAHRVEILDCKKVAHKLLDGLAYWVDRWMAPSVASGTDSSIQVETGAEPVVSSSMQI